MDLMIEIVLCPLDWKLSFGWWSDYSQLRLWLLIVRSWLTFGKGSGFHIYITWRAPDRYQ